MLMIMQGFNQHSDPFWKNESKVQITRIRKKLSAGFCDCSVNFFSNSLLFCLPQHSGVQRSSDARGDCLIFRDGGAAVGAVGQGEQ